MAQKAGRSEKVVTPEFRVCFPSVFEPKAPPSGGGDPKFSVVMMFPKTADISVLKKAAMEAVKQRWGDSPPKGLRSPFQDGDGETETGMKRSEKYPEQAGHVLVTASSKQRPGLVDQAVKPILNQGEFYAGCYARATVNAYTYGGEGTSYKPGVAFGLMNIQKLKEGGHFGSRTRPEDDFESVAKEDAAWDEGGGDVESLFG